MESIWSDVKCINNNNNNNNSKKFLVGQCPTLPMPKYSLAAQTHGSGRPDSRQSSRNCQISVKQEVMD